MPSSVAQISYKCLGCKKLFENEKACEQHKMKCLKASPGKGQSHITVTQTSQQNLQLPKKTVIQVRGQRLEVTRRRLSLMGNLRNLNDC